MASRRLRISGQGLVRHLRRSRRAGSRPGIQRGTWRRSPQLYTDLEEQIAAAKRGTPPGRFRPAVPGIKEGVEGVQFIEGVLKSSEAEFSWVKLPTAD